jgi:hypothetical protein
MEVIQVFDRPASRSFYTVAGRFLFVEAVDRRLAQLVQQLFAGWQLTPTSPPPRDAEIEIKFFGREAGPDIPANLNQFEIAEGGRCYTEANAYYLRFGNSLLRLRQGVPVRVDVWIKQVPEAVDAELARVTSFAVCADNGSLVPLVPRKIDGGTRTLDPGTYCGGLIITNKANVTLRDGTYIMNQGPLIVDKGSSLTGDYVGFYFKGDLATLKFDFDSVISLSAPKVGAMAGLLFYSDPGALLGSKFRIYSDNARRLLGTIYLPKGDLYVDANKPIADQSAYTVIVARTIELYSGPNLVLNANYGATDVPVPQGVGPTGSNIALSQ